MYLRSDGERPNAIAAIKVVHIACGALGVNDLAMSEGGISPALCIKRTNNIPYKNKAVNP